MDFQHPPPRPRTPTPRTPTQSPHTPHRLPIHPKSPHRIPPPPLPVTPRTPVRPTATLNNIPQQQLSHPSPRALRQNPPPPPPKRTSSQHHEIHTGILAPPYSRENSGHLPSRDRERRSKHRIHHELNSSADAAGFTNKRSRNRNTFCDEQNYYSVKNQNELNQELPRYNRANSVPVRKNQYKSNAETLEEFKRSHSSWSYERETHRSRNYRNGRNINMGMDPPSTSAMAPMAPVPEPVLTENVVHQLSNRRIREVEERENYTFERCIDSLMCIFPKVEPLPWSTFFLLTFWCALPPSGFITFFTAMGFGEQVYYAIADEFGEHASTLAVALLTFMFALYMLDADQWNSVLGTIVLDLSVLAVVAGFVLLVLLLAYRFPYGMVCLFALFNPLWLLTVKLFAYKDTHTRIFVSWLSSPLFTVSALIGLAWALWVFADPSHQWNEVTRIEAASYSQCQPNYEVYPDCRKMEGSEETCFYMETISGREHIMFPEGCGKECTNVYDECLNGFILWVGPVLVSMTMIFLSFFCTFFREEIEREKDILNFGKIWIFIVFAMWVTASLSGTAAGVTSVLVALTLASFVASAVFLAVSFSKEERAQNTAAVIERLREKYDKHLDVIRGLFIWLCAPVILVYSGFSIFNQFIRRTAIFPCSQPARGEQGQIDMYTARTRAQINVIKSWDRAKVYTYAIYWGVAFMVLEVIISKLTVVFLSWLIVKVSHLGLGVVTGIMWVAGMIMFLLPPIPGVPVYLTLGVVLPAQGYQMLGWVGSIAYSIMIGLLLKLFSSAIQQKIIGEQLSHYVYVRQLVGINSTLIRAMRLVVGASGLSIPKVALLVGGPDWPTSVLCGIMRLSLPQIMLGTVPIIFLIIPTCVTGTFLYMASIEEGGNPVYPWAQTVSTITAACTALVQFGAMILAAYYLEQAADKRVEEMENIPIDDDVKEADEQKEIFLKCYADATRWSELPWCDKAYLRISLTCIITSTYMVHLFSDQCFKVHSLTDSIEENLNGNAANLFLPLGWVSVSLFLLSCVFLVVFKRSCNEKARQLASRSIPRPRSRSSGSIGRQRSPGSIERQRSSDSIELNDLHSDSSSENSGNPPGVHNSMSFSSRF